MARFGVSFSDVADNSPKQERTMAACMAAICYAAENSHLLDELLRTADCRWHSWCRVPALERKQAGTAQKVHISNAPDSDQWI